MHQDEIEQQIEQLFRDSDQELREYAQCFNGARYKTSPALPVFNVFQLAFLKCAEFRAGKQRTLALDHLLISKDAAVRAVLFV